MNLFRRPERPMPDAPSLVERTPLTDAEIECLLADPDFVAWRSTR